METGTKGIACGRCDADLPTPAIVWRLHRVRDELQQLLNEYRWYSLAVQTRTEHGLQRQHNTLVVAAATYAGFARTCRACPDVLEEINVLSQAIQAKLDRYSIKNGIRIVLIVVKIVKIVFGAAGGHLALPAGSSF